MLEQEKLLIRQQRVRGVQSQSLQVPHLSCEVVDSLNIAPGVSHRQIHQVLEDRGWSITAFLTSLDSQSSYIALLLKNKHEQ